MIREEGAELVCTLEEAIVSPESEAKEVVNYCSFVSTVVRRFKRVPILSQSCLIMSLRSWMSEVVGRGRVGCGLEWRMEGRVWRQRRLGRKTLQEWCGEFV
jgi:hypothetical protein